MAHYDEFRYKEDQYPVMKPNRVTLDLTYEEVLTIYTNLVTTGDSNVSLNLLQYLRSKLGA